MQCEGLEGKQGQAGLWQQKQRGTNISQRARGAHHPAFHSQTVNLKKSIDAEQKSRKWENFRADWVNKYGNTSAVREDFSAAKPFRVVHMREKAPSKATA